MACLVQWLKYSGARDSTGAPVASGKVYFWEAGTSDVPASIFSDPDGAYAISHPVSLDAAGRASVYVDAPCSVEIQSSTGTTVATASETTGIDAAVVKVYGAYDISTDDTGTDLATVLETISSSLSASAVLGTGVIIGVPGETIDNKITIASNTGKILFLPPGTYYSFRGSTSPITTGLCIVGSGVTKTVISTSSQFICPFVFSGSGYPYRVSNLTVQASGGPVFTLTNSASVLVDNVDVYCIVPFYDIFTYGTNGTLGTRGIINNLSNSGNSQLLNVDCPNTVLRSCRAPLTTIAGANCSVRDNVSTTLTISGANCSVYNNVGAIAIGNVSGANIYNSVGAISWGASSSCSVAYGCAATGGTTGYAVNGNYNGCVNCYGATNSTADFSTAAAATNVIDAGNRFVSATPRARLEYGPDAFHGVRGEVYQVGKSSGAGSQAWTPDPRYQACAWRDTGAGAPFTLTVNATATTGLADGQRFELNIANPSGFTMTITPNAQYVGPWPATLTTGKYTHLDMQWCAATSKWDVVDGGSSLAYTAGMFT